jgi:parallel beta-helix repeat protein
MKYSNHILFRIVFLIVYLLTSVHLSGQIIFVSGDIPTDTTWTADTVKVTGDITVQDDVTLTILPGTVIQFQDYHKFNVLGTLIAAGSTGDSILFTSADTNGYYLDSIPDGGWGGLIFNNSSSYGGGNGSMGDNDSSRLSHCIVEYVKGITDFGSDPTYTTGGIYIRTFSRLVIEYSQVRYCKAIISGGGIAFSDYANPVVRYNLIHHNEARNGGGVVIGSSEPLFHHNIIRNNSNGRHEYGRGAGLYVNDTRVIIESNEICYNSNEYEGGGVYSADADFFLQNNTIYGNDANVGGGIFCRQESRPSFINNYIFNNSAGSYAAGIFCEIASARIISNCIFNNETGGNAGGVFINYSNALLLNNTIVNNLAYSGGGIYSQRSNPEIVNNILWGNEATYKGPQIYLPDNLKNPIIRSNTIEDGFSGIAFGYGGSFTGIYENNLELNPDFMDPTGSAGLLSLPATFSWQLSEISTCINQGTHQNVSSFFPDLDHEGETRVLYGTIDMGALEKQIPSISVSGTISSDSLLMADTIFVTDHLIVDDDITLTIAPGCMVRFLGNYKLDVWGTLIACGTEEFPITFTMDDTLHFSSTELQDGGWQGIIFDNGGTGRNGTMHDNDTSMIKHCIIEYVKTLKNYWSGPITIGYFNKLIIFHNIIRNNLAFKGAAGIYVDNSEVSIIDNIIENNKSLEGSPYLCAGGLSLHSSDGIVKRNTIRNNYSPYKGGGLISYGSKLVIRENIISHNSAGNNAGGIYLWFSEDTLTNNIISNNTCQYNKSVYLDRAPAILTGNLICNNDYGLYASQSDIILINNTIVNNDNYGLYIYDSDLKMLNTLLWGNSQQAFFSSGNRETGISNCLIRNGISGILGTYQGNIQNIFSDDPDFKDPSSGRGHEYNGLEADYSTISFSPCINNGTTQSAYPIPGTDINGMPRIYGKAIDIGAYENQDKPPVISKHPLGGTFCKGDTVILYASAEDTARYQWMKDGENLAGETGKSLVLDPITRENEGNYYCLISNAYDTLETVPAYIHYNLVPEIIAGPEDTWAVTGEKTTVSVFATGKDLNYQWFMDGDEIQNEILPEYEFAISDSAGEGHLSCIVSNYCGSDTSRHASLYLAPQICMVTVDPITGSNLVIWEKKSKAPIDTFNIYRESKAAGIYDLMGTVSHEDLSIFGDSTADPTVQAYLYKITCTDTSGYETDIDLCKPHKTIHLLVSTNPELNTTQLEWDKYYGFEYQTYNILRSATGINFEQVHEMASSLASWTDPDPLPDVGYYRITVEKPDACYPTGGSKKAESGPYSHSLSNIEDNRLQAGQSPPDTIMLTNNTINENNMYGMLVGRFNTTDQDTLDTHTYSLVSGEGDNDNISFTILGDMLLAAEIFDYEKKENYSIRVRCTDKGNLTREEIFAIHVNDAIETGLTDHPSSNQIQVYPNPFNKSATLLFNNPEGYLYTIYIMDLSGKVCRIDDNINTSRYVLEKGNLKEGFYFIELRGTKIWRGKIVIE